MKWSVGMILSSCGDAIRWSNTALMTTAFSGRPGTSSNISPTSCSGESERRLLSCKHTAGRNMVKTLLRLERYRSWNVETSYMYLRSKTVEDTVSCSEKILNKVSYSTGKELPIYFLKAWYRSYCEQFIHAGPCTGGSFSLFYFIFLCR